MSPEHEQLYRHTLRDLVAAGVEFCVIGSFGLRLQCPALAARPAHDCDLLLPFAILQLNAVVQQLQAAGWEVTLWEEPVRLPLTAAQLRGKYYLRARQAGAVLDLSFENAFMGWEEFAPQRQWRAGIPVASRAHLLYQCARRNTAADQEALRLCGAAAGPDG